jgi:hypothetical protein
MSQLLSQVEALYQITVSLDVLLTEICQKFSPLTDQFDQSGPGMLILFVLFEMFCQINDPFGQQGYLDLRRTGI